MTGTTRRRSARVRTGAGALLLGLSLVGCAEEPVTLGEEPPSPAAPSPSGLGLPSDPVVLLAAAEQRASEREPRITQLGTAKVKISIVDLAGGTVAVSPGRDGLPALDFPKFSADDEDYPRAVVAVTNAGPQDQLNPGTRDFVWGGDFRVDQVSVGTGVDNGDNLVQRGISSQPTLFKAEIDHDRPACTVRGDLGELIVRARERIRPGWWYRIRCERTSSQLTVYVTEFEPSGLQDTDARRVSGPIGDVSMEDATTPLTVGGKIGSDMKLIPHATDQFNGLVLNPVYAIE